MGSRFETTRRRLESPKSIDSIGGPKGDCFEVVEGGLVISKLFPYMRDRVVEEFSFFEFHELRAATVTINDRGFDGVMTIVNTTILLKHTVAYTYSKLVVLALAGGGLLREDGLGLSVIIWITQGLCHIWNLRSKNHLTNSPPIPSNLLVNERAVIHASKGPHLCSICAERIKHKSLRLEKDRAALTREHPYLPIRTCGIQRSSKNSFVLLVKKRHGSFGHSTPMDTSMVTKRSAHLYYQTHSGVALGRPASEVDYYLACNPRPQIDF